MAAPSKLFDWQVRCLEYLIICVCVPDPDGGLPVRRNHVFPVRQVVGSRVLPTAPAAAAGAAPGWPRRCGRPGQRRRYRRYRRLSAVLYCLSGPAERPAAGEAALPRPQSRSTRPSALRRSGVHRRYRRRPGFQLRHRQ